MRGTKCQGGDRLVSVPDIRLLATIDSIMHEVIEDHGEYFLVQDGPPAHNDWQQGELLEIT